MNKQITSQAPENTRLLHVLHIPTRGIIPQEDFITRPCQTDGLTEGK